MSHAPPASYLRRDPPRRCPPPALASLRLRAVAGIGRPERFFETLRALGLQPESYRALPDHHQFGAQDIALDGADALVVTEKDAVKLHAFAPEQTWVLRVDAEIQTGAFDTILERLDGCQAA